MEIMKGGNMNIKKIYIAPTIEVVEIVYQSIMTATSGETGSTGVGNGTAGNGPDLATKRRGSWGNLW